MARAERRVAVIGGGVSGLTAAYVLRDAAEVTLYEADPRLGGHADTHDVVAGGGQVLGVDTGFIVHNARTYPTLMRLFDELGVATQDSDMSMSVVCEGCGLQYAGARGPGGLFPTLRNAANARYLWMLAEVVRFHRRARAALRAEAGSAEADAALHEFLRHGRFSTYFVRHFMTPLVSCVWSCAPCTALDYPARYLFAFLDHHGMLAVTGSPTWRTVVGGSRTYVDTLAKHLPAVRTSAPVRTLERLADGGLEIRADDDRVERYDQAVVAVHPGQALALLAAPTSTEADVLGAFAYSANPTVLHTDTRLLPTLPRARASWNYRLAGCDADAGSVLVSYDMNRLQNLAAPDTYVVTLNPGDHVGESAVLARMNYEHPIYTPSSVAAQRRLGKLNDGVLAYAGAYHGWGFHEDGARSGVTAAASLGVNW